MQHLPSYEKILLKYKYCPTQQVDIFYHISQSIYLDGSLIILFGRLWILESIIADFDGGGGAGVVDRSVVICVVSFERYILIFV